MGRKKLNPYEAELRAASKELGQPVTSWHVERLATLTLLLKVERHKWSANHQKSDGSSMLPLIAEITAIRQQAGLLIPRTLTIDVVKGAPGYVCAHCGKTNGSVVYATPTISKRNPGTVDLVVGAGSMHTGREAPAATPAPANIVPIDPDKHRANLRAQARVSNGIDPGPERPPAPRTTSPLFDTNDSRSISQFQRDVDAAYRVNP